MLFCTSHWRRIFSEVLISIVIFGDFLLTFLNRNVFKKNHDVTQWKREKMRLSKKILNQCVRVIEISAFSLCSHAFFFWWMVYHFIDNSKDISLCSTIPNTSYISCKNSGGMWTTYIQSDLLYVRWLFLNANLTF